ncbi:spectrin alpha chain, non-erythrocytic 1 isoform X4 [Ischnura elegans]|uniref:spectrin alpha chain, non-erythrocytic 1 isoform X4 n=1 Tax=Ischnura elegans TaxID=197161 RepID=UPI001ED88E4F|nr:spectrin alpha chain, non-erythrocytic 1 isoform X4 [Ischnura elegans]
MSRRTRDYRVPYEAPPPRYTDVPASAATIAYAQHDRGSLGSSYRSRGSSGAAYSSVDGWEVGGGLPPSSTAPSAVPLTMTQREDALKFETGRIKALQEERLYIQKKTFTKWMNSFLLKARMEVEDLFEDLADGRKLLKLLEIISGEKLGKPNTGHMRVHKIENVNKSLAFLHTKVRLESIGAEDIVDGNPRLILGLIWTIILRFQIQEIEIDVDEENESSEKKSAKDALLLWCQRKTSGYNGVNIQDFTGSWRSGLGFNALIHAHRPDLIDYQSLVPSRHMENLNRAFDIAQEDLGIPKLLDAEDVDTNRPDEKSIITYVASYYHTFARMKNEMKSGRRIANIVGQMMEADAMKKRYSMLTTNLLEWIIRTTKQLSDHKFPNSLEGIQSELTAFKTYRTVEKPPKYRERSEIEVLYFHINTHLKSLHQPQFVPMDGQLVHDIERAWEALERAEHAREVALRQELLRQERLEQLAFKFRRKSVLRESFLKDMTQVLCDPEYGSNLAQLEATMSKHEAMSAEILAREDRFHDLTSMADELVRENYHGKERVIAKEREILARWDELLVLLGNHRTSLTTACGLMALLREIDTVLATIKEMEVEFQSVDVGGHLLGVEDLLQKHSLTELQATAAGETQSRLQRQGQAFLAQGHKEAPLLQAHLEKLAAAYKRLLEQGKARRARLEDARNFFQFAQDQEEEEAWVIERQRVCKAGISAKDLRAVLSLQQKHKSKYQALLDEMKSRRQKCERVCESGQLLIKEGHPRSTEIGARIESLRAHWKRLEELALLRKKQLEDAAEAYQFYTDANEAESWLREKTALVGSTDCGEDEPSAQALLQRHRDLQGEIVAYSGDINSLNTQAERLIKAGISKLELSGDQEMAPEVEEMAMTNGTGEESWTQEVRLVPQEYWDEEEVERTEMRTYTEERLVPQVKSLYAFSGQGMVMAKGEVMYLVNKTNEDWWSVRKGNGMDGFVPANYVKEIEPKLVPVQVQRPKVIKERRRVRKTRMVPQPVRVPVAPNRTKSSHSHSFSSGAPAGVRPPRRKSTSDTESVEVRQKKINDTYNNLKELAQKRQIMLEDAIRLYSFYRECEDFEKWIKDKEKMLRSEDRDVDGGVEAAKRKYENFLTDLSASAKRIEALDAAVDEFEAQGHSQLEKVRARQAQIHRLWDHLNWLKTQKEKSLEGASSVELFNRTCDEARDWMLEKMEQLEGDGGESGLRHSRDLKTVQALQRRHQHLERELAPVQEKVNRVNLLADSVKSAYPDERANVLGRQKEIQDLWQKVMTKAAERRSRLEDAVGQQIFMNNSKNLLNWMNSAREALSAQDVAKDVPAAEELLQKHKELRDDIIAHQDEFKQVANLGRQLLQRGCAGEDEVRDRLKELDKLQELEQAWAAKNDWLDQCHSLQVFNREADRLDAATSGHLAFLEYTDLGESIDDVNALLGRHEDFRNTLHAQEERFIAFGDMAQKLIASGHYDSPNIAKRCNQVLERRNGQLRQAEQARYDAILASAAFHTFSADADEFRSWLADKAKTAGDESYRDLTNLERKLQKHEAFECELRSNEGRLRDLNKAGQRLVSERNYRSGDVKRIMDDLNSAWEKLVAMSADKGRRLRQASAQHTYNRTLEDARLKLEEIETSLQSQEVGVDLRSCNELLKKQQVIENDLDTWERRIGELVSLGQEMADDGHFDADTIRKSSQQCLNKFSTLKEPARLRREALEESLRYHKFTFEVDAEQQWVRERMPLAASEILGSNLHQAQTLHKKHEKLKAEIVGHRPTMEKALASGKNLLEQKHPRSKEIEALCDSLKESWKDLEKKASERGKRLQLSLKAQQFFFEAGEVEGWLAERRDVLSSTDFGRDRDAATKLLTKHKALELELDTYSGIVAEMGRVANAMANDNHPDSALIVKRHTALSSELIALQRAASARQRHLVDSLCRHEYFTESAELEQWIKEQEQAAASEDYGHDYEHLLVLQNKFEDFKHRIEAGTERFNQCEELAKKLITNDSPYLEDIEKKQDHISDSVRGVSKDKGGVGDDPVAQVAQRHQEIRERWKHLQNLIENRERRLHAAGEIHRFHRDAAEALSRIQEKSAALPEDSLGRDLHSVLALIRRHEGFENDLVALEAQLQILVEDSARLQAQYPGDNAVQIAERQAVVVAAWDDLQEHSLKRREDLQASCDLQKFLTQVRDLSNWASGLRSSMLTEERVRDAASAQALKVEHEALKAEIEAREELFHSAVASGEAMVNGKHYASKEIEERFTALLNERQQLHAAWQHKKVYLDQLIDLHFFLRDAKQMDAISSTQEVALTSVDLGTTVEEVSAQLRRHEAFGKLLRTKGEERENDLSKHGEKLLKQGHFDKDRIAERLESALKRRDKVRELWFARGRALEEALLYTQFVRDVGEAESWIGEKAKKLAASVGRLGDGKPGSESEDSLEEKVKKLQKHQAFQAELVANAKGIEEIRKKGEKLIEGKHRASREIRAQLENLLGLWRRLQQDSDNCGRGLEEAQDILEFNNQVEQVEAWIRDKEMLVQAGDLGRDYEHCQALVRKLEDATAIPVVETVVASSSPSSPTSGPPSHTSSSSMDRSDSRVLVDEPRMRSLDALADRLIRQGRSNTQAVHQRREELNAKWRDLQGALADYRLRLRAALEVHGFVRDVDETRARIGETCVMIGSSDTGNDLAEVEALERRHEGHVCQVIALEDKVKEHETESRRLCQSHPTSLVGPMREKMAQLQESWRRLLSLQESRRKRLTQAHKLHEFHSELRKMESWVADVISRMSGISSPIGGAPTEAKSVAVSSSSLSAAPLPTSVVEADAMLELHNELKAEIDGRQEVFRALKKNGLALVAPSKQQGMDEDEQRPEEVEGVKELDGKDIEPSIALLSDLRRKLIAAWEERRQILAHAHQLQVFLEQAQQADEWLASKEAFLANDDLGDSLSSVEALVRRHEAFEKTVTAQASRVEELEKSAREALSDPTHLHASAIGERLSSVCARRDRLMESAVARRRRLRDSYDLQKFLQNFFEVESWIHQKLQGARDESYRDPSNLQSKTQRHAAFEAEIVANSSRVSAVMAEGESLVGAGHFASMEIQSRVAELESDWRTLQEALALKRDRLQDAYQALLFGRTLDDLDRWMEEAEHQLASEDHGKDPASVRNLLRKHKALEADAMAKDDALSQARESVAAFKRAQHFMADELKERVDALTKRYEALREPMQIRRSNLEEALQLQQYLRDVDDETRWLEEKEARAASTDLGNSLMAVQTLQKKHQVLETEIMSREPVISAIIMRGQQMVREGHFAGSRIDSAAKALQERVGHLRDLASVRRLRLQDAIESQMYYAEANEAEAWILERQPLLMSSDVGQDEDSAAALIKRLDAADRELGTFQVSLGKLAETANNLVQRGHFDAENISKKQDEVENAFMELKRLSEARRRRLEDSLRLFRFIREADDAIEWVSDQTSIAASEDYGQDVEHVEILTAEFEAFACTLGILASSPSSLTSNGTSPSAPMGERNMQPGTVASSGGIGGEAKINAVLEAGANLCQEGHPESTLIQAKMEETRQVWEDLKELAHARSEALAGAKQVHLFDRTVDETIGWIQEKETELLAEDYGQDMETIQALSRKHQAFESDLEAVREKVLTLVEEAHRIGSLYPDARDHIESKKEEATESWNELEAHATERKDKLGQRERLQAYFQEYRELMAWINDMLAKVTAPDLARDVPGAEALVNRHNEYHSEIETRTDAFDKFYATGNALIQQGHFMSGEIQEKINILSQRKQLLNDTWDRRRETYELNLDTQIFKREADMLEGWLQSREGLLRDGKLGESIAQVEELLRRHDDFEKTVEAQEDKFNALRRFTMLEERFALQKQEEEAARKAEKERVDRERAESIRRREVQRITEERRREEEYRGIRRPSAGQIPSGDSRGHMGQQMGEWGGVMNNGSMNSSPMLSRKASLDDGIPRNLLIDTGDDGNLNKTGSISQLFGDRIRRDGVKRAESMKVDNKKVKRTPSFTTRRRTQSFRKLQQRGAGGVEQTELPPVEIQGNLDRKHELQSGGKKAAVRSWKTYYTVLCGQLLCFFKDMEDFLNSKAATSPINVFKARCEKAQDYTKRKHVFRLCTTDGSEYLFLASTETEMEDWVNKISFHAQLPPNLQLLSYDDSQKGAQIGQTLGASGRERLVGKEDDNGSTSSPSSSPELRQHQQVRRASGPANASSREHSYQMQRHNHGEESHVNYQEQEPPLQAGHPYHHHHQQVQPHHIPPQGSHHHSSQQQQPVHLHQGVQDRPPIPPRGPPPPVPVRSPTTEAVTRNRLSSGGDAPEPAPRRDIPYQHSSSHSHQQISVRQNGVPVVSEVRDSWRRREMAAVSNNDYGSAPPLNRYHNIGGSHSDMVDGSFTPGNPYLGNPNQHHHQHIYQQQLHYHQQHQAYSSAGMPPRQQQQKQHMMRHSVGPEVSDGSMGHVGSSATIGGSAGARPTSLPPYVAPPPAVPGTLGSPENVTRRPSESSSESEFSASGSVNQRKDKDGDRRSTMLSYLFRKKKGTHL